MRVTRVGVFVLVGLCLVFAAAVGQDETATVVAENLSEHRTLGVGIQVDSPWGGLISARYWFSPSVAAEGVVFLWGEPGWIEGSATGRILLRIMDAPVVDFYAAAGATLPFSPYGETEIVFSGVGGIEFGFRFAPSLAWNIEFGMAYSTLGNIQMVIGTGIHFYF